MEQPLVSVLTITRNRGNLLRRCINSVLSQTYKNIEHIIIDGASDDNTDDVIAEFKDDRLHFIKLEYNWPIKESIDHGVSLCKGKYLTFLDSDDEYVPEKIEKQLAFIESLSEDYGFIYCWMNYYDSSNNKLLFTHNPTLKGFVGDESVIWPVVSGTPSLMFRLDFFRSFGGWKSKDEIGKVSDWEMCCRACQLSKVDYLPEPLVKVYVNHGSIRQSEDAKYYKDPIEREIKFRKYFLTQFEDIFERHPKYAVWHYVVLARSYRKLGKNKEAWRFFKLFLGTRPKFIDILKQFFFLITKQ